MQRERKLKALRTALGDEGWTKGDEGVFFCHNPKGCNGTHGKRKLSVNLKTDVFHCWVCGWKGKDILPILKLQGDTDDSREYASEFREEIKLEEKKYDPVRLPKEFRPLWEPGRSPWYRQAKGYLERRGITSDDILLYKIGYAEDGEYANRIILPSFDEFGELNFLTGRAFFDSSLKYKHGNFCKDIIFNDYLINWHKPVTLVEGPFDAIKAGLNAIPLQGTILSDQSKLFYRIVHTGVPVNLALDNDAWEQIVGNMEKLIKFGVDVNLVQWPKEFKDPGEMTKPMFEQFRSKAIPVRGTVDLLKLKVFNENRPRL
jgi:DNA primase